jgi:glycosyltransferase involved in cell wall biosynthesis
VLHPTAPGEEGLSDEVRPFVEEIVALPRGWQAPTRLAPFGTPERYLWTFSPELRAALAAELGSRRYDVANLEYEGLWLHAPERMASAATPALFVFHELASFAKLAELPATLASERDAGIRLAELLGALRFDAVAIPDRCARLATLTEPEARHLLPFVAGRELAVLPIPVDVERLSLAGAGATREPASFVFVGTFRHPPNLAAADELIAEIAPRLRARLPQAAIRLVGADPPPELVDRAAAAGVETLGWVDDLPALLARSTAFLAPLRRGAGMRVKLLEAMAAGCPVVSTGLGMSGIAAPPGAGYLRAESVDEFVAAAVELAGNPAHGAALARSAFATVERDHSIAKEGERRERIWAAMLAAPEGD